MRAAKASVKHKKLNGKTARLCVMDQCETSTEKIILLLWKHNNDKKNTDSEQIVFRNEIFQYFNCLILFGHVIIHHGTIVYLFLPVVGRHTCIW